jgi:hypothetical protein
LFLIATIDDSIIQQEEDIVSCSINAKDQVEKAREKLAID